MVVKANKFEVNDHLTDLDEVTVWLTFPQEYIELYEILDNFKQICDPVTKMETNCHTVIIGFMRALVDDTELLLNHLSTFKCQKFQIVKRAIEAQKGRWD